MLMVAMYQSHAFDASQAILGQERGFLLLGLSDT